jgi:hypothetical protein
MAAAIDADGFEIVLANDCRVALTPYVMRYLRTPSLFFCHHNFSHWDTVPNGSEPGREAWKRRYYAPARRLMARVMRRDERRNAQRATAVLTQSEFARAQLRTHYGVDAVAVGAA